MLRLGLLLGLALSCFSCLGPRPDPLPPAPRTTRVVGEEIVVAGQRFPIHTPVVLWTQFPGYDATRAPIEAGSSLAYQPGRVRAGEVLIEPDSTDLLRLQQCIDQFVLHYDVCGLSRTCFRVLQERKLSVHFLLDIDGTLYQTMDLRDQAFHATKANPRSIGVEIAQMGAYPPGKAAALDIWYRNDADGPYIAVPERLGDGGVRTVGFVARPARAQRVQGKIHGELLEQYDFTPEQYAALAKLSAALSQIFPKLEPDAPRDAQGLVLDRVLSDSEFEAFGGILGHYHVQRNKTDPGPAFDWERFLAQVRQELARSAP